MASPWGKDDDQLGDANDSNKQLKVIQGNSQCTPKQIHCNNLITKVDLLKKKVKAIVSDTHKQGVRMNEDNEISILEKLQTLED